jgi:hypothetical protein
MTDLEIEREIDDAWSLLDASRCLRDRAERIITELEAATGFVHQETLAPVLTLVRG